MFIQSQKARAWGSGWVISVHLSNPIYQLINSHSNLGACHALASSSILDARNRFGLFGARFVLCTRIVATGCVFVAWIDVLRGLRVFSVHSCDDLRTCGICGEVLYSLCFLASNLLEAWANCTFVLWFCSSGLGCDRNYLNVRGIRLRFIGSISWEQVMGLCL